jgi:nucleotide-binding universal stress UspA family protein
MSESKRILVGIDGSEYSPAALRLAGRLASALGAPLHVVTCLGYSDFYLPERVPPGGDLGTPALLIVGRPGRGGLLGQLMGSVSAACTAHAHCPVVVVSQEAGEDHGTNP